jgi:hypothetical protein
MKRKGNKQQATRQDKELRAIAQHDKKWNMKHEQLVEFKRNNGHCMVPFKHQQDKSLGQ